MTVEDINSFWLDEVGADGWYIQSNALDDRIRTRYLPIWQEAAQITRSWLKTPQGVLAALILTDQFPRNMFRGDSRAFATDELARQIATDAIESGFDLQTPLPQRQFYYLPFEHSEDLSDQHRAVELFQKNMPGENLRHARLHRDTIAKFGRFPWRNQALGRDNTPQEQALLDQGGYGALVSGTVVLDAAKQMV